MSSYIVIGDNFMADGGSGGGNCFGTERFVKFFDDISIIDDDDDGGNEDCSIIGFEWNIATGFR